jgi:hypothetical protein
MANWDCSFGIHDGVDRRRGSEASHEGMANPDISYLLGGTGYQPVAPGHWPGAMKGGFGHSRTIMYIPAFFLPSGESPLGTGALPVLPI